MKEKPIIFTGALIHAILAGKKTQTRRVVKHAWPLVNPNDMRWLDANPWPEIYTAGGVWWGARCPYGVAGDRLWVRESFVLLLHKTDGVLLETTNCKIIEAADPDCQFGGKIVVYRADNEIDSSEFCDADGFSADSDCCDRSQLPKWKSPIHMPRWASRITLEIITVRVDRIQSISDADVLAEGFESREALMAAWERMHGNWGANPWVWVIEFKEVEP